ncbi:MAG: glycosyltransferase family 4 protein [Thermoflexales bacterium]|nr:glycosyltransferase family 4 protein [Thermoflexales bacterium]
MLNHYALPPDLPGGTRHFDLGCELARLGYDVTIFASAFNHSLRKKTRLLDASPWALEELDGVRFVWLPSMAYQGNDWRRLANMLDYTWRAYWLGRRLTRLARRVRPPDVIMGCAVHLFAVLAAYGLSRHYRARFLMEVRDLWPQTFLDMGVWREGQPQVRFFRCLEQFLYQRAEKIIVLSPLTGDYLAQYSPTWAEKTLYIPNGTRLIRFEQNGLGRRPEPGAVCAMYLGAMGITNGLELILDAMQVINQQAGGQSAGIDFCFVGDGPEKGRLQHLAKERGLHNVRFEKAVPRARVPDRLAEADILVLVQKQVLYGSSNKLFDYMAAAKPIVFALLAEHNNLVEQARCGVSASPDDPVDLAQKILQLARMPVEERQAMGGRGRAFVRENHDYSVLARRLLEGLRHGEANGRG